MCRSNFNLGNFQKEKRFFTLLLLKFKEQGWIPLSQGIPRYYFLYRVYLLDTLLLLRGHSDTGKTTALLEAAVNAQKAWAFLPVFVISEMKWSWDHAKEMGLRV